MAAPRARLTPERTAAENGDVARTADSSARSATVAPGAAAIAAARRAVTLPAGACRKYVVLGRRPAGAGQASRDTTTKRPPTGSVGKASRVATAVKR